MTSNSVSVDEEELLLQPREKMMHLKIGVIGKMCSGKTTLSNFIKSHLLRTYGIQMESMTFAGKLYELAYDLFDMDKKNKDRRLLQMIGSNMRAIDKDVWVKYVMKKSREKDVMVEDCRYRNEFEALVREGFIMIKINIDEDYQKERLMKTYPETYDKHIENLYHASEMDIDGLEEEKCELVLDARDNELNYEKTVELLDRIIGENKIMELREERRKKGINSDWIGQYEWS